MTIKLLGGILLIAGTCIGGGMLGLPIATAKGGLLGSTLLFILCWMLMTFTGLLTLEVNLYFPKHSNVISMARHTLGKPGEFICWTLYLFFLYALVAAYIAGGQDVLRGLLSYAGVQVPLWVAALIFVFVFGTIVMAGIEKVDMFNRILMVAKLITLIILIILIGTHVQLKNFAIGHIKYLLPAISVAITSFGFSIIIPSLRAYFNNNITQVRLAIILGSLLPLFCYIIWVAVIFGLVPLYGEVGLAQLINETQPITGLLMAIKHYLPNDLVNILANTFTSICVLTAFACVSLGLSDYLYDGFKLDKEDGGRYIITTLTFLPPLLVVLFYPKVFIFFLSLAGLLCVALQSLMPAIMAWRCRYNIVMSGPYQVYGGKMTLSLAIIVATLIIFISLYQLILGL